MFRELALFREQHNILRLNLESLICAQVDIIVNTVSTSLDLNGRKLSAVLSSEAGPALQEALNVLRQEEQVVGSVISTDGFRLKCKKIYHIVTPGFDREVSEQVYLIVHTFEVVNPFW